MVRVHLDASARSFQPSSSSSEKEHVHSKFADGDFRFHSRLTFVTIDMGYIMFVAAAAAWPSARLSLTRPNDSNCRLSTGKFKAAMKGKIDTCHHGFLVSILLLSLSDRQLFLPSVHNQAEPGKRRTFELRCSTYKYDDGRRVQRTRRISAVVAMLSFHCTFTRTLGKQRELVGVQTRVRARTATTTAAAEKGRE